jgi:hypothetical protein
MYFCPFRARDAREQLSEARWIDLDPPLFRIERDDAPKRAVGIEFLVENAVAGLIKEEDLEAGACLVEEDEQGSGTRVISEPLSDVSGQALKAASKIDVLCRDEDGLVGVEHLSYLERGEDIGEPGQLDVAGK